MIFINKTSSIFYTAFYMAKAKVSVLIPVYNSASFLRDAVQSILNQTYTDFELILLNDASTDNSEEIIKSFTDPRIQYHSNPKNLGISGSRNKLLDLAQGEYLAIMDHDDISLPTRLEKQVRFMNANPEVAMLGTWGELFCRPKPRSIFEKLKKHFINLGWVWCQPKNPTLQDMAEGNPVMHSSSMLRKSALLKHNIRYNPEYTPAEDYDLCRQILEAGLKLANIQEILFKYHYHGKNHSLQNKKTMALADKKVKEDVYNLLNIKKCNYPYYKVMFKKLRLKLFL